MSQAELSSSAPAPISLEQLLALNEEIRALVQAGIPLERGLMVAGRDLRGRLGRLTAVLAGRLQRGESLVEALKAEERSIPPLYRAVVEAGARSGRLPVALEGLARYVRGYSDARSGVALALWYPMLVVSLAYILFWWLVVGVVPRFTDAFGSLGLGEPVVLKWLEAVGAWSDFWLPVGLVLLLVLLIAWFQSGRAARFGSGAWSWMCLLPGIRPLLADYEAANFSELLALLLEHQVAYPAALALAAEATGNARMTGAARQLAEAVSRGEPAAAVLGTIDRAALLPMLRWVLATGQQQGSLVEALRNLADLYRSRARFQAEKLYVLLPTVLLIVIGASATLLYGLAIFLPLINILRQLSL
jgi:type II secretory pathway component PulF